MFGIRAPTVNGLGEQTVVFNRSSSTGDCQSRQFGLDIIDSQLLRRCTARESSTELVPVSPAKVKAHKCLLRSTQSEQSIDYSL